MNIKKGANAVPGCCCDHTIAKTAQDCSKQGILLEAVAPTRLLNQLFKDFAQVRTDELFVLHCLQVEHLLSECAHKLFQGGNLATTVWVVCTSTRCSLLGGAETGFQTGCL